jgi:three-Cys-motif partner protein
MSDLIIGDDGLPAAAVKEWAKEKHEYLRRYINASRAVRKKWLGSKGAGATYIDLFSGPGRCQILGSGEWIDGGVVAAWKMSVESDAPFTQIYVADLDTVRRDAAVARLKKLGAPVIELHGDALAAAKDVAAKLNPHGLHFAFLDPFSLEALNFEIIEKLSRFQHMDILVHVSQMDLQRNAVTNAMSSVSAFDSFAPGWRDAFSAVNPSGVIQREILEHWRELVIGLGAWPSDHVQWVRADKNQPLYRLLMIAKHQLPLKLWSESANISGQRKLDF